MSKLIWSLIIRFTSDSELREYAKLRKRYEEINIKLMRKSAEAIEAQQELERWRLELETLANLKGHNLCFMDIPTLLKRTIGHTGQYPDPDGISPEEFGNGCVAYHRDIFPKSAVKLMVVKADES